VAYTVVTSIIPILGAFAKLRKATISFVTSVCPSARTEQLGSHRNDFLKIWYLVFRKNLSKQIQVPLKSDNNNEYFTRRPMYIFDHKAVPLQAWSGPEGSRKLRFPDFLITAKDGGTVVSLTHRPHLPPGNTPGTHFC
jgi:hypothetical protein